MTDEEFERLAALYGFAPSRPLRELLEAAVRAEREACAKVCEGRIGGAVQADGWWSGFRESMRQCAAAIRARSKE